MKRSFYYELRKKRLYYEFQMFKRTKEENFKIIKKIRSH